MTLTEILELAGRLDDFTRRGARVELADDGQRLKILTRGNPDPTLMAELANLKPALLTFLRRQRWSPFRRFPDGWRRLCPWTDLPTARENWLAYLRAEGIPDSENLLILSPVLLDELSLGENKNEAILENAG